jgi:uncharacterized membrane protein YkoI
MQQVKKTVIAITITGVLTGSALAALADSAKGKPFEGVVVEDVVVMEQFPTEVQNGSIQVKHASQQAMVAKTRLSSNQAADIAIQALPGKVVETRLDEENGYLIWDIEVIGDTGQLTQLKIDAGNGHLLAMESGDKEQHDGDREDRDEGRHSSWKFWERHDQDEGQPDND